jgi:hypothetical protein
LFNRISVPDGLQVAMSFHLSSRGLGKSRTTEDYLIAAQMRGT